MPYVHVQDDWWYPGEQSVYVHCVKNWTLGHPAFSHDLGQLSRAIKTPWCVLINNLPPVELPALIRKAIYIVLIICTCRLLYAPFFCASDTGGNVYSSEFRFIESLPGPSQFSEPHPDDSERFYNYLFDYGVKNGMRAYENDFANYNLLAMPLFRQEFNASTRWLGGMNAAAVR